jgi:hypothetical protein
LICFYWNLGTNASMGDLGNPNSDHPSCCDVALGVYLVATLPQSTCNATSQLFD